MVINPIVYEENKGNDIFSMNKQNPEKEWKRILRRGY